MGSTFLLKIFNCWDFLQLGHEHPPKDILQLGHEHPPLAPVYFPDELIPDVLSFLPVKSVLRFRCVSKTLNSLITDPTFIKLHLNRSARNDDVKLVYTLERNTNSSFKALRRMFEDLPIFFKFPGNLYNQLKDKDCFYIVGSCNGLHCLYGRCLNHNYTVSENWLRIWNPATSMISEKVLCSGIVAFHTNLRFDYDISTNTYKVLYFIHDKKQVRVLTLGDNVWRNIQNSPVEHDCCMDLVHMRGSVIWLAIREFVFSIYDCKNITLDQFVIISLNLGTETHIQLRPPRGLNEVPIVVPKLSVLKDCLCFAHDFKQTHLVIWQMKEFGVEESWTQFFKICYHDILGDHDFSVLPLKLYYSEKNDALFFIDNYKCQAIIYNRRYNRVERTNRPWLLSGHNYVESLVWYC